MTAYVYSAREIHGLPCSSPDNFRAQVPHRIIGNKYQPCYQALPVHGRCRFIYPLCSAILWLRVVVNLLFLLLWFCYIILLNLKHLAVAALP